MSLALPVVVPGLAGSATAARPLRCRSALPLRWAKPIAKTRRASCARRAPRCQPTKVFAAASETALGPAAVRPKTASELGPGLENPVVVLEVPNPEASEGVTRVYVLGISHVSKADCQKVEALIRAVQPEVVMVELCKERTGLLVDPKFGNAGLWHTRKVELVGLPEDCEGEGWPSARDLLSGLRSQPGRAFTLQSIEDDCERLLASGLFRTVRPVIAPPGPQDAPHFAVEALPSGKEVVRTVEAMGAVSFEVTPRVLPPVMQCDVELATSVAAIGKEAAAAAARALVAACQKATPTLDAILGAQAALREAGTKAGVEAHVDVSGVETGRVTLSVTAASDRAAGLVTGLESSAVGGKGWGIEPAPRRYGSGSEAAPTQGEEGEAARVATKWRPWTNEELDTAAPALSNDGFAESFGMAVARVYAGFQADAGRVVGIPPGAAWRAALSAAAAEGVQQVQLGDRSAEVTRRRLAVGIFDAMGAKVLGSVALLGGAISAGAGGALPEGASTAVIAAAAVATGVAAWPLVGPIAEVAQFSKQSAKEIEETVRVKSPLQDEEAMLKLWGEDAITDFPGAQQSVIAERDVYMAEVLHAAATGAAGAAPAYVLTGSRGGKPMFSYMMPEGGPASGCPPGTGAAAYAPLKGVNAVVGVVGTAHVAGIKAHWRNAGARTVQTLDDLTSA